MENDDLGTPGTQGRHFKKRGKRKFYFAATNKKSQRGPIRKKRGGKRRHVGDTHTGQGKKQWNTIPGNNDTQGKGSCYMSPLETRGPPQDELMHRPDRPTREGGGSLRIEASREATEKILF